MSYAIVGFGKIGQALARALARKNIDVTVASRRPPEALAPQARAIGPTVVAKSLQDALKAETIILAVPFGEHREVAKALPSWTGKTIIDATNGFGEELDGRLSSAVVAKAFTGAIRVSNRSHRPPVEIESSIQSQGEEETRQSESGTLPAIAHSAHTVNDCNSNQWPAATSL